MNETPASYQDTNETIYAMMARIVVVCPRCESCAVIAPQPVVTAKHPASFMPRRLVCGQCRDKQARDYELLVDYIRRHTDTAATQMGGVKTEEIQRKMKNTVVTPST